jgi:hypothetical protein
MDYMIMDSAGNAVEAFQSDAAAIAALVSIARSDAGAARHLAVIAFDEHGDAIGEPLTVADVVPEAATTVVLASASWVLQTPLNWLATRLGTTGEPVWRASANLHVGAAH